MPYQPILDTEIAAGQPITSGLITRLRDNPLALISAVPTELVSPSNTQTTDYTSTYEVPTGVTLLMVICVGGGGGGAQNTGQAGTSGRVKCGFVTTTGGANMSYTIGGAGAGTNSAGNNGGDTIFDSSITGKGGFGGSQTKDYRYGPFNDSGEQKFITGGVAGARSTYGAGGGAAGVPWFLRTSSLGNGGNGGGGAGGHATGYGAGGGAGIGAIGGNGTAGIIFVLPLQA